MHNGFVNVDKEKMSKSLGNFFRIRDVLKNYDAEVVRFFILRAHYRSPLNYSDVHLDDAKQSLNRLYTALKNVPAEGRAVDWNEMHAGRFKAAMDDDFNTARCDGGVVRSGQPSKCYQVGCCSDTVEGVVRSAGVAAARSTAIPARCSYQVLCVAT